MYYRAVWGTSHHITSTSAGKAAHQNEQLFSTGEENAIAEYTGIMADAGFPLSPNFLWQIAQGSINERECPSMVNGGLL